MDHVDASFTHTHSTLYTCASFQYARDVLYLQRTYYAKDAIWWNTIMVGFDSKWYRKLRLILPVFFYSLIKTQLTIAYLLITLVEVLYTQSYLIYVCFNFKYVFYCFNSRLFLCRLGTNNNKYYLYTNQTQLI